MGVGLRVREIVADVREVRARGAEARDDVDRFADAEVRGVWTMPQRVENHRAYTGEQRPRFVGDAIAVGQVREFADAESEDRQPSVEQRHRYDLDAAERERAGNRKQRQLWNAAAHLLRRVEHVREHPPQAVERRFVAEARNRRPLHLVVPPHVVETEDVIGVAVGEENCVDAAHVARERLRAEVGRGVDENRSNGRRERRRRVAGDLDPDRGARPLVARIRRSTHSTIAADRRNAARRAAAQDRDAHQG